jgi:hypothetical protein
MSMPVQDRIYWVLTPRVSFLPTKLRGLSPRANYSDSRLSAKLVPTFANRGCHLVSVTDPYGRSLGFLDRSRYFFSQVAPKLYSRGWVDPVLDPLLLRKFGFQWPLFSVRQISISVASLHECMCVLMYLYVCMYIYIHVALSIRKSLQSLRRQAAVARSV